jgi:hypothetical protein
MPVNIGHDTEMHDTENEYAFFILEKIQSTPAKTP